MEIPDQNMIVNLNILVAIIKSFKMLIGYTMDLTPTPLLRLAPIPPPKEREDEEIALKFPLVMASCGPCYHCKHPKQILSSALGNKPSDAPFKKLTPKLSASHTSPREKRASF